MSEVQFATLLFAAPFLGLAFIWIVTFAAFSVSNSSWMDD